MSESKSNGSSAGIGLFGCIFLVFLFMKLAEIGVVASWSWWWVTAPLWLPFGLFMGALVIFFIIKVVIIALSSRKRKNRW